MNKSGIASNVISHPQGGGAAKGIEDSFSPDLHTGTGNLSVPIALPPARNNFQPALSLLYSTGQGNGHFGMGWAISVPGVTRDASKGVPKYMGGDLFTLAGAERLIPIGADAQGRMRYRPRTEGVFARIVQVQSNNDDYWDVRTREGLRSLYGYAGMRGADPSVVCNPDDALKVFSWSLTETTDPFGNRIEYEYERGAIAEEGPHRWDQVRLKTIRYGDYGPKASPKFLVGVSFIYENRPDPFSSYRAGFEVRTTKRCARIEIHTNADSELLVRSYRLVYADQIETAGLPSNGASLLRRIIVEGVDGAAIEEMPPLEFNYTRFDPVRRAYHPLTAIAGAAPEHALSYPDLELADLFGCGLPDFVQIGDASRYWRNLGGGHFDTPRPLQGLPNVRLGDQGVQLADLDGDGQIDLLVSSSTFNGYFPLDGPGGDHNRPSVAYPTVPSLTFADTETRFIDLDGDGVTDALRTGQDFELYYHDRENGWDRVDVRARDDLERFPDVRFSDPRVKLADMSGDGLQDIVLIDGTRVDYWPYLGHGRWGRRVTMSGQVKFPDAATRGGTGFDAKRVLLGDVDGDGLADLVYVESGRVTIWLNQSGNGWSEPIVVHGTPPVSDIDAVRLADMLGEGAAGILWTYDFGRFDDTAHKFLDFTGGVKPYLLNERINNAGARILIEYASSTRFYVEDEVRPETRWRRRLPFPIQVVAKVSVFDLLSGGKLTTEYRYHQGYWDGEEREFRGFGFVEQFDTEQFGTEHETDPLRFSPPMLTRTWFHQGQVEDSASNWSQSGIGPTAWPGDPPQFKSVQRRELSDIARNAAIDADPLSLRQACRALRGSVLRTELYALDGAPQSDRPYTVSETAYDVREIRKAEGSEPQRAGVFFPFQVGSRTTQWERGADPMTQYVLEGAYDAYGLAQGQLTVAVPRGRDPLEESPTPGEPYLCTYATTEYARRDDADCYIVDRIARSSGFEVLNDGRPTVWALHASVETGAATLRSITHSRNYYDGQAFTGLPLGALGDFGAVVRVETLAFTDAFLDATFDQSDPAAVTPRPCYFVDTPNWTPVYPDEFRAATPVRGGYAHYSDADVPGSPGGYYVVQERRAYDFHDPGRVARGLQTVSRDPLGSDTRTEYDAYDLFPVRVVDPVGLATEAAYDYRAMQVRRTVDANGNIAEFDYSPSGFLIAQYARGKNGEGDLAAPSARMEYDLNAFAARGEPISVRTIRRVHHDSETDVAAAARDRTIETAEYSDGFGRLLQTRTQAEDTLFGDAWFGGSDLSLDQSAAVGPSNGRTRDLAGPPNVVVSGWQIYDNKGRVVEAFEPFFARGWTYQQPLNAQMGQKAQMFYDARGQVLRTVNPDASEQRVVFGAPSDLANPDDYEPSPWEIYTYDANDNAGRTHAAASASYARHWNTPASSVVDSLGRVVTAVARNGDDPADWHTTQSSYDIVGNLLSVTDPLGRVAFRYTYDLLKRAWRSDSIDAGRRDDIADVFGNPIESRDSKGAVTLNAYDVLRRPARLWARDDAAGPVTLRQRLQYGDGGRANQPAAERNAARAQNLLGQVIRHHDEAGLTTIVALDFKGNFLDKSRRVIADAPILAALSASAVAPFQVDWGSDATLAAREAALLEPTAYSSTATYDALNRIKRLQLPEDVEARRREIAPVYNNAGGLEQVWLDGALFVERIAYDAKGQRALIAYGNGVMTRYAYDPQTFRLKRLRSERYAKAAPASYTPSGDPLQDFTYDYDLAGNILAIIDRTPECGVLNNPDAAAGGALAQLLASGDALIRRFIYDPLYRLESATGRECDKPPNGPGWSGAPRCEDVTKARLYTEDYEYDKAGNIERLAHASGPDGFVRAFSMASGSNRLTRMEAWSRPTDYVHDDNGNLTSESRSRHFDWNHADQMKAFRTQISGAEPSEFAQYFYDAAGQRVKKLVRKQGGQVEVTHYIDGAFEHRRWSGGESNTLHVMDDAQRIALVRVGPAQAGDTSPAVQFQLGDHLVSSALTIDLSGAWTNREEFTPYGETSFGGFSRKRYRYTGMERDEESGLAYHGARYYAAWTARWRSCDPIGMQGGLNLYAYAGCNPINYRDSTGLDKEAAATNTTPRPITRERTLMGEKCYLPGHEPAKPMTGPPVINYDADTYKHPQMHAWTPGSSGGRPPITAEQIERDMGNIKSIGINAPFAVATKVIGGDEAALQYIERTAPLSNAASAAGGVKNAKANMPRLQASRPQVTMPIRHLEKGGSTQSAPAPAPTAIIPNVSPTGQNHPNAQRVLEAVEVHRRIEMPHTKVAALFRVDGKEAWGFNGKWGDNSFKNLSAHWGHAEVDSMKQARAQGIPTAGREGELWVSMAVCQGACLSSKYTGNIVKAAEQLGLTKLTIYSPNETIIIEIGGLGTRIPHNH